MDTTRLKFFLPWWPSDYVFDGWTPMHDLTKENNWSKRYFWNFFPDKLDGILVSRMAVSPKRISSLRQQIGFDGVIIGDSGAHTNSKLPSPPYSCEHLLEYYALGSFNYGMHLDVVAAPWVVKGGLSLTELRGRQTLTLKNAEQCLNIMEEERYHFQLIGVVQGWSEESYLTSLKALIQMGYSYVAVAGQKHRPLMVRILWTIFSWLKENNIKVKIHILGTGNPKLVPLYQELGVTSFDSANWLRHAWLGPNNYYLVEGANYQTFQAHKPGGSPDHNTNQLPEITCECPICALLQQDILVFRGHERNTRRGYHNVHQYLKYLDHLHIQHRDMV